MTETAPASTTRTLRVDLLDPFGNHCQSELFELAVPRGGSKDEDTDDRDGGEKVAAFVSRFAAAMAGGGLAFTVKAEFVEDDKRRAHPDESTAADAAAKQPWEVAISYTEPGYGERVETLQVSAASYEQAVDAGHEQFLTDNDDVDPSWVFGMTAAPAAATGE